MSTLTSAIWIDGWVCGSWDVISKPHLDIQTQLLPLLADNVRKLIYAKLLSELIENAHLSLVGWVVNGDLKRGSQEG